jgi:ribose/xylose/arabinose/galactoside ABC-type transport system permease subunit
VTHIDLKNKYSELKSFLGIISILAILSIILSIIEPRFLSPYNLRNVLRLSAILSLVAYGEAVVIIGGGIDLSIGSIAAVASVLTAMVARSVGIVPGFACGILTGALLGTINGVLISRFRLPAFIATFGMLVYAEGIANYISRGAPIEFMPEGFGVLGSGYLGPIPIPIIISVIVFIFAHVMLSKTPAGRYLYAIGGNEKAAWLSGINVKRYKLLAYTISGLLAGLAAVVLTSRINSGQSNLAPSLPFDAIAAAAVGGLSMRGGYGKIYQPVLGAMIISVANNGLNLLNISSYIQMMVIGGVILIAVSWDNFRRNESFMKLITKIHRFRQSEACSN